LIVIAILTAAAMVRAASGAYDVRANTVRAQFAASAAAVGLAGQAAAAGDPTPVVHLTAAVAIAPGTTGAVAASGKFPAGTTANLRGSAFSITDQTPGAAKFVVTVSAKPGVAPAVGYLEFVSKDGKRTGVPAVYVPGKWTLDGTAENGWTLHVTTDPASPSDVDKLDFTLTFLKAGETKPFETRTGNFSLEPQTGDTPHFSTSLQEPMRGQDPECAAVTKRLTELTKAMAKGMDPKTMAEFEKINDKYSVCAEKMSKASEAMMKEMQDPNYAKNEEARRDNFGCSGLDFETAADGATTGTLHCGKNIGRVKFTGTLKRAAQ
jgi:hypothetical protein